MVDTRGLFVLHATVYMTLRVREHTTAFWFAKFHLNQLDVAMPFLTVRNHPEMSASAEQRRTIKVRLR